MTVFDARLATRVSRDVRRRLRLTAAITGKSISETLDGALARALPTDDQLADGLRPASKTEATIALILRGGAEVPRGGDNEFFFRAAEDARRAGKTGCPACGRLVQRQGDGTLEPHHRPSPATEAAIAAGDWVPVSCEGAASEAVAVDER